MRIAIKKGLKGIILRLLPEIYTLKDEVNVMQSTIKDISDYVKEQDSEYFKFMQLKKITRGYLTPTIYSKIYKSAIKASEGYMIDIGPAQGGSSIALCWGIRDSNKVKSKVISIEKGQGSAALVSNYDVEANKNILYDNIVNYGLANYSIIFMGDVHDVGPKIPQDQPISLIFIDADGALDRDLDLFFNRMIDNSPIIIDDYVDIINTFAINRYLKWESMADVKSYVKNKGAKRFVDLCPLGKEYTTFRFINYLIESELIIKEELLGNTFFGRKNPGAVFFNKHKEDLFKIRKSILVEYLDLNPLLKKKITHYEGLL